MARYKGRPSSKDFKQEFSHIVEVAVPRGGLGKRLDLMHAFHTERGIKACLGCAHSSHSPRARKLKLRHYQQSTGVVVAGTRSAAWRPCTRHLPHRLKTFAQRGLAGFDYSCRVAPRIVCMATIAMGVRARLAISLFGAFEPNATAC